MESGLKPRKARGAAFLGLGALFFLAGCLQFDVENTVSWSPDGSRVAFLSGGSPWLFSLDSGAMTALPTPNRYLSVAWSPRPDWIALSTSSYIETFQEQDGVFASSQTFSTSEDSPDMSSVLMWHPQGRRLLYSEFAGESATTSEVDLDSGVVTHLGAGIGLYGPGADWLLWAAPASIGKRGDRILFDRQSLVGESMSLDKDVSALEAGFFGMLSSLGDNAASLPLCARSEPPGSPGSEVHCLDAEGRLQRRAVLPVSGRVFPDRTRSLFAVVEERGGAQEPRLSVYDSAGLLKADGSGFLKKIMAAASDAEKEEKAVHVSRLAWSPDGNWIAWAVNGRLCLWNWRNDEVRIHAPPAPASE